MHPRTKADVAAASRRLLLTGGALFLAALPTIQCAKEAPATVAAQAVAPSKLRFEPAQREHDDIAVGETLTERIALVADSTVEWGELTLTASCDCLDAKFVGEQKPTRAGVELTIFGRILEDVDGHIDVYRGGVETTTHFATHIVVTRRPFVQPREVFIEKGPEGRFEIVVGQAFALKAKAPEVILPELGAIDESKLALYELGDGEREHTDESLILRTKLQFIVIEEARAQPFETAIPITFGEPPVTRTVKIHWPGK